MGISSSIKIELIKLAVAPVERVEFSVSSNIVQLIRFAVPAPKINDLSLPYIRVLITLDLLLSPKKIAPSSLPVMIQFSIRVFTPGSTRIPPPLPSTLLSPTPPLMVKPDMVV